MSTVRSSTTSPLTSGPVQLMDALGLATLALYSTPYLAAAAFHGAPLWNVTPSRRKKRQRSRPCCSQLSTPDRGTISLVRSSSQVRKSLTKSWHPRLWISALQPSLHAPTLAGSASVTTIAVSRPATGAGGGTVGWGAAVGAAAGAGAEAAPEPESVAGAAASGAGTAVAAGIACAENWGTVGAAVGAADVLHATAKAVISIAKPASKPGRFNIASDWLIIRSHSWKTIIWLRITQANCYLPRKGCLYISYGQLLVNSRFSPKTRAIRAAPDG